MPGALSGLASGVLNTSRFVGAALGLAVLTTLAVSHTGSEVDSGTPAATAVTDGIQLQFEVGAAFAAAGMLTALIMLRPSRTGPARAAGEPLPDRGAGGQLGGG
jgi:hypothetical protein